MTHPDYNLLIYHVGEKERVAYMKSVGAIPGEHMVDRENVFEDVIDLYRQGEVVGEYPIKIEFFGEIAVDFGGLLRDMFSGFWETAYSSLFEGATLLTPMIHPQIDTSLFPIVGRILSHAYLVCGILPIRIALPSLTCMLLGPTTTITGTVLLETFLDYISASERTIFKDALTHQGKDNFPSAMQGDLMNTLSLFGCRNLPTPSSIVELIEQVARYEFVTKPAAGIAMIHSGIPLNHKDFWKKKSSSDVEGIYHSLTISPRK